MTFSFPTHLVNDNGIIKELVGSKLSNIDIMNPIKNILTIDNVDYFFTYLEGSKPGNKGGNSILLKLYESQYIDLQNIEYGEPNLVLKILRFPLRKVKQKSHLRFDLEIEALEKCKAKLFQNVITIYHVGECSINNSDKTKNERYLCYTMEYAGSDLKKYIEQNHDKLNFDNKIQFCLSISEGLKELYSLGYYHRDIKPDNIFIVGDTWKIGDLGLLDERNKSSLDDISEFVGPRGWLSPEAMNKYLSEGKNFQYGHDCIIDHQSDIFQLGKVFWYIFQHNAPIGNIKEKDFIERTKNLYPIIRTMLNHSKKKRYKDIDEVTKLLKMII